MKRITKKDRIEAITEHMKEGGVKQLYAIHVSKGDMIIVLYRYINDTLEEVESKKLGKTFIISEASKEDDSTNIKPEQNEVKVQE